MACATIEAKQSQYGVLRTPGAIRYGFWGPSRRTMPLSSYFLHFVLMLLFSGKCLRVALVSACLYTVSINKINMRFISAF